MSAHRVKPKDHWRTRHWVIEYRSSHDPSAKVHRMTIKATSALAAREAFKDDDQGKGWVIVAVRQA